MIRSVIVGCAHMHANEVALYISGQTESELVGVADTPAAVPEGTDKRYTRKWNLKNISETYRVPAYDDYRKMLNDLKPDVAYLLCENYRKAEIAEEIASRGIDVVIEKPMAATLEEAEKIAALPAKYGVEILVNWPVAWRPYLHTMKKALDDGIVGNLQKLRYLNGHTGPLGKGARHRGVSTAAEDMTDEERARTWWYQKEYGGGAYLDILCYGCYFSLWMFGKKPESILSVSKNLNTPFGDAEDNVAAIFDYKDGFAVSEGTWTTPRRRMPTGPEAVCSEGVLWCDGTPDKEAFVSASDVYGQDIPVKDAEVPDSFKNMPWHYAAHKLHGKEIFETLTVSFNKDVVSMLDAARRSDEKRKEVKPL